MTRQQELAEEMAKVIGWSWQTPGPMNMRTSSYWIDEENKYISKYRDAPIEFFFNPSGDPPKPEGFHLLWNKFDPRERFEFYPGGDLNYIVKTWVNGKPIYGSGPNRHTAFYEAVHEMRTKMTKTREERIAEWLGFQKGAGNLYYILNKVYMSRSELPEWLASAKGERAVMDKLQINNSLYWSKRGGFYQIVPLIGPNSGRKYIGDSKTRQEALLNAVEKMLEGKKDE